MSDFNEKILLKIAGNSYSGWKRASVKQSLKALSGSFEFDLVDSEVFKTGSIKTGDKVEILIVDSKKNRTKILTGSIDEKLRTRTGETETIKIKGREATADLVDCTAIVTSNTFTQATLAQIVTAVCKPFGIPVVFTENPTKKFKKFTIQSEDTAFTVIDRVCKLRGVIAITDSEGRVEITNTGNAKSVATLRLGDNILSITEKEDIKARYSKYTVKGQDSGEGGIFDNKTTAAKGIAKDTAVERYRPLVLAAETKSNTALCQERANWEAQYRSANSKSYKVTVLGWFQSLGGSEIWPLNGSSNLIADAFETNVKWIISDIEYNIDGESGRISTMTIQDPAIFKAKPQNEIPPKKKGLFS